MFMKFIVTIKCFVIVLTEDLITSNNLTIT